MKHTLTLLTALLLVPLAVLHATDAPIAHRVLCTDYKGNRVVILSARGDIEWEFPAKTPQDCWQIRNLADDPAYATVLAEHRRRLDAKLVATKDPAPESMAMYDSDMKPYVGKGSPEVERNIAQMKRWAAEGK